MIVEIFSNFFHTHHFYRLFCVDETNQKEIEGSCVLVTLARMCVLSYEFGQSIECVQRFINLPALVQLGFVHKTHPFGMCVCVCALVRLCLWVRAYKAYESNAQASVFLDAKQYISNWFLQPKIAFSTEKQSVIMEFTSMKYDSHGVVRF